MQFDNFFLLEETAFIYFELLYLFDKINSLVILFIHLKGRA